LLFADRMRRLGIAALALLVALVAAPAVAGADGIYFTEGFGATRFDDDLGQRVDRATRLRVSLGFRSGQTAVEAWIGGDLADGASSAAQQPSAMTYGLDVKRIFRIAGRLEGYVRGSMSRMAIEAGSPLEGYSGRGLGVGTGVQVKGKLPAITLLYLPLALVCLVPDACRKMGPMATVALFVDQGYDFYRLHRDGRWDAPSIDAEATRWTFGFAIGSDF
jgi:hypothetical protein